jgi:hypothetical protein
MKSFLAAITAAALLTPLSFWLIHYCWPQHHLYYLDYRFDESEAQSLAIYPQAMLAHGDQAWQNLSTTLASTFYRRAVKRDALYIDAWIKLAQTEAALGHLEAAQEILAFVAATTSHTSRWQSSIALLAHELDMEEIFRQSVNFLVARNLHINDAFTLVDAHSDSAQQSLVVLNETNHPAYLDWLIKWNRVDEARLVWRHYSGRKPTDESILLKYVDFLVLNKVIDEAQAIWLMHTGATGVTNGDFVHKPGGNGFFWRAYPSPERHWHIFHADREGRKGTAGIKILFSGKDNIDFHHFYQIVPLRPEKKYHLIYGWRGRHLTTDQGPFVELTGYDCDDFYTQGPMQRGSFDWRDERVEFELPPDCNAIVLRLRRNQSTRFDNKFGGKLWLDDFRIEPIEINNYSG